MNIVLNPPMPVPNEATNGFSEIVVHVQVRVVTATQTRRKVNGWLCMNVGDRMLAGEPELLLSDPILWRVPVQWTSPTQGVLVNTVGYVMVDALTGRLLVTAHQAEEIQQYVDATARALRGTAS